METKRFKDELHNIGEGIKQALDADEFFNRYSAEELRELKVCTVFRWELFSYRMMLDAVDDIISTHEKSGTEVPESLYKIKEKCEARIVEEKDGLLKELDAIDNDKVRRTFAGRHGQAYAIIAKTLAYQGTLAQDVGSAKPISYWNEYALLAKDFSDELMTYLKRDLSKNTE